MGRREFHNALPTEIGFPALDAAGKEPAYLTIKIAPEYTRVVRAAGNPSTRSVLLY